MSKSLRTILLSVLIIVLAASSALAGQKLSLTFKWVGTNGNYWGHASNWLASSGDISPVSYDAVKDKIVAFKDGIEFYPGSFTASDDATCSVDVQVIISKDATIAMTQNGAAGISVGSLVGIRSIDIVGTSSTNTANVVINMGDDSWFEDTPSITVQNQFSKLRINGGHSPAFNIKKAITWKSISADLELYMPVSFASNAADLILSVDNASLVIGNSTLLGSNADRKTHIYINQVKDSPVGKLVFDVATTSTGAALDISLKGKANRIDALKNVTLNVWSVDVKQAISSDSFDKGFVKGGSATLTLNKAANAYERKGVPVISTDKISVVGGTLAITGAGYAPLGRYGSSKKITFTVENASLDLGSRTISADEGASVDLIVKSGGKVFFRNAAVDVGDVYSGGTLQLKSGVSADVRSGGLLHLYGSQAVAHIRGAGTIESEGTNAILILKGDSDDIKNFTGTIRSLDIGIVENWPIVPFLTTADGSINTLYVFGPNGALTLDSKKLAGIEGLEETNVYLRSNIPGSTSDTQLRAIQVGQLYIRGDIALNVVSVDGTKSATYVGAINFSADKSSLTVNKLAIHANADKDFGATNAGKSNVYVNVRAVDISGPGTFTPKAIVNGAGSNVKVGNEDSIVVEEGATLKLNGVKFPEYNSLLLKASSIDVDNATRIYGNFIIGGKSRILVSLTDANARTFETSKDIEAAAIVVNGIFKLSEDASLSVDIKDIDDQTRFLGEMYSVVGYPSFDIGAKEVTSVDATIIGKYSANKSILLGLDKNGLYAQLVRWLIKPRVYEWEWINAGDDNSTLGMANKQFEARIGYGLSDDIEPDITNLLVPSIALFYDGNKQAVTVEGKTTITTGQARQNMSTKEGERIAFLEVSQDKVNHYIYLSGTSYKTSLDVGITLSWDLSASSLKRIADARITPKVSTGGSLTPDHAHNGPIVPEDLVNLELSDEDGRRPLENKARSVQPVDPENPARSKDIDSDVDTVIVSPTVVYEENASADFEFSIPGLTAAPVVATPALVKGVYVWNNGISSTDRYMFNGEEVTDVQVWVNNEAIPMADVTLTPDANGNMIVSIPVSLLGSANGYLPVYKNIKVTAKAVSDNATFNITGPTVTITAKYADGEVEANEKSRTVKTNELPFTSEQIAEYSMTDPVSADATVDGAEKPAWLTLNVSGGVVAYALTADAPVGTHNITIYVHNADGAYKYEFTVTVNEGFKVNYEELYDTYAGMNYVANFTAANAPAGTVEWTLSTDVAWLRHAMSGDVFVVFGRLPDYREDEEDEGLNDYAYTVTAKVGTESASESLTITVDQDETETTDTLSSAAGDVATIGNINSADKDFSIKIDLKADYYGEIDFELPYWLVATPVPGGEEGDDVVGYTITYKAGVEVPAGEKGVVRFEDPGTGDIVSWLVTSAGSMSEPVELTVTATPAAVTLSADATATVTMSASVEGVTYTSNKAWAVVVSGDTVRITAPAATDTATITGTAPDGRTATVTITVTVRTSGEPTPAALTVTASQRTFTLTAGATATVTMSADVEGVTYTSNKAWAVVSGNTVTITAPAATDTATITGTASDGRTATVTITVTVRTSGEPTPATLTVTASQRTFTLTAGATATVTMSADVEGVTYSSNKAWAVVSGNTVTITAPAATDTATITGTASDGRTATVTITVTVTGGNSGEAPGIDEPVTGSLGSSGGGCDAGFGALALALAAPLFLRRRRS